MGKDKTEKKEKKDKKPKKEKKSRLESPVEDTNSRIAKKDTSSKKSKSSSRETIPTDITTTLLNALDKNATGAGDSNIKMVSDVGTESKAVAQIAATGDGLLVPFAQPLAEHKAAKKVLKCVKKGAKNKCLKRGVKEVVKALRKSPTANASAPTPSTGLVVLAADISPMDVISHIPVLCEDHGIPYIFISSRAELGAAGATKRPTSVVMVMPGVGGKKSKKGEEVVVEEGFKEAYDEAVNLVELAQKTIVY